MEILFPNGVRYSIKALHNDGVVLGESNADFTEGSVELVFDEYFFPFEAQSEGIKLTHSPKNSTANYQAFLDIYNLNISGNLDKEAFSKIQFVEKFSQTQRPPLHHSSRKILWVIGLVGLATAGVWWQWILPFSSNSAVLVLKQEAFMYHSHCEPKVYPGTHFVAKDVVIGECVRPIDSELRAQVLFLKTQIQNYESQIPAFKKRNEGVIYRIGREYEQINANYEKAKKVVESAEVELSRVQRLKSSISQQEWDTARFAVQQAKQTILAIAEQASAKENELNLAKEGVTLGGDPKDNLYNPAFLIKEAQAKLQGIEENLRDTIIAPVDGIFIPEFSRSSENPLVTRIFSPDPQGRPKTLLVFPAKLEEAAGLIGKSGEIQGHTFTIRGTTADLQQFYGLPNVFLMSGEIALVAEFDGDPIDISMVGFMDKIRIR